MGRDKYGTNEYVTKRIFGQNHIFHIVPNNFPIIEDGIIGLPCLEKYNYSISNDKIRLSVKTILFLNQLDNPLDSWRKQSSNNLSGRQTN